jgi:hypothetical protein
MTKQFKLTAARIRNLRYVEENGHSLPKSNAGYYCRVAGWVEFVFRMPDGRLVNHAAIREAKAWGETKTIAGERLTDAGKEILARVAER